MTELSATKLYRKMLKIFLKIFENYKVPHFTGGCLLVVVAVSDDVVPLHFSLFVTTYIEV